METKEIKDEIKRVGFIVLLGLSIIIWASVCTISYQIDSNHEEIKDILLEQSLELKYLNS